MKSFFKKSVAIILFSTILCGFFGFGMAKAQDFAQANYNTQRAIAGDSPQKINNEDTASLESVALGAGNLVGGVAAKATFTVIETVLLFIGLFLKLILTIVGTMFDWAMVFSISHLSEIFKIDAINNIWALVRDTLNVFFIFMLLWIAIQKIIGSWGTKVQVTFGNLILGAIFINFSMFVAKFLIDIGNIVAITFYNQIIATTGSSITGTISQSIGLFQTFGGSLSDFLLSSQTGALTVMILQIAMLGVTIYVFAWALLMFVGRAVMLLYLVIISPIAFVGNVLPKLREEADKWWKDFIDQLMVAPVFLFFLFIIIKLLVAGEFLKYLNLGSDGVAKTGSYFYFVFIIMMLFVALGETKKMSGKVAGTVLDIAKKTGTIGAAVLTGGTALAAGGLGTVGSFVAGKETTGVRGSIGKVSGAFKGFAGGIGKFADGKYEKEPGLLGDWGRSARGKTIGALKDVSGGFVDIKALDKRSKENEDRVLKKAAGAIEKAKENQRSEGDMRSEAKEKAAAELKQQKDALEKEYAANKQNYEESQRNLNKKDQYGNLLPGVEAAQKVARESFDASQRKIEEFSKQSEEKLKNKENEIFNSLTKNNDNILKLAKEEEARKVEGAGLIGGFLKYGATKSKREAMAKDIRTKGEKAGGKKTEDIVRDLLKADGSIKDDKEKENTTPDSSKNTPPKT